MRRDDGARDPEWARLLEAACPAPVPRPGAEERVLERIRERQRDTERASPGRSRAVAWAAVAVACAFAAGIAIASWLRSSEQVAAVETTGPSEAASSAAPAVAAPARGAVQPRHLTAADADELVELQRGARVLARAGTTIELSEGAELVECRLGVGEVLVHVPEGSRGKFVVVTSGLRIAVAGTVFGVSANEGGKISVSVWEGRVEVHEGAARTDVVTGESWPPGAAPLRADGADMARLAASARVAPELLRSVFAPRAERHRDAARVGAKPAPGAAAEPPIDDAYARARRLEIAGDRAEAAQLYERVAAGDGATAEAAAFAAARLYSGLSNHAAVWRVLSSYRARHPDGTYARASDVLLLRSLVAQGDSSGIEREAERFLRNHPGDPRAGQFRAARALDRARRGRCVEARVDLAEIDAAARRHVETLCSAPTSAAP